MKNVAIITPYWENSPGGGILTYLKGLVSALHRNSITVKVVFRDGKDSENIWVKGHRFIFPIKAFLALRKISPEIIHSHSTWYCLMAGYLCKKHCGTRLIHTFHTLPDKRLPLFVKILMQFLVNRCDCVTFVSQALKDRMEEIWGLKFKNTAITYAGVNFTEVTQNDITEFRDKFGLKDDSIILLAQAFTANKLKAEGAKLLIQALGELKDNYPNMVLILTREGAYSNELRGFCNNLGLNDKVVFTGDIANPYIPLSVCDLYTHISLSDGLPMALLEAMSMGKPIITTSVGGIPEAIIHLQNGILIEPNTYEIMKAIEQLLMDKELASNLGRNAKGSALENFTWDQSVARFLKIYEDHK